MKFFSDLDIFRPRMCRCPQWTKYCGHCASSASTNPFTAHALISKRSGNGVESKEKEMETMMTNGAWMSAETLEDFSLVMRKAQIDTARVHVQRLRAKHRPAPQRILTSPRRPPITESTTAKRGIEVNEHSGTGSLRSIRCANRADRVPTANPNEAHDWLWICTNIRTKKKRARTSDQSFQPINKLVDRVDKEGSFGGNEPFPEREILWRSLLRQHSVVCGSSKTSQKCYRRVPYLGRRRNRMNVP